MDSVKLKGGSWYFYPGCCRSAVCNHVGPGIRNHFIGFRLLFVKIKHDKNNH